MARLMARLGPACWPAERVSLHADPPGNACIVDDAIGTVVSMHSTAARRSGPAHTGHAPSALVSPALGVGILAIAAIAARPACAATEFFTLPAFEALSPQQTLFTFDELSGGDGALNGFEYSGQGMFFLHRDGLPMNLVKESPNPFVTPFNFASSPNVVSANFKNGAPYFTESFGDNFDFIFNPPVQMAGLFIGNFYPGQTEVQFLAADGSLIAGEIFTGSHPGEIQGPGGAADNRIFYGVTSLVPIARIRTIEPGNDADGIVYDDIRYAIPKPGDLDLDGSVDGGDLATLLGAWGPCSGCPADLNGDGVVDAADLAILLGSWGS